MTHFSTSPGYITFSLTLFIRIKSYGNIVFPQEGIAVLALQLKHFFWETERTVSAITSMRALTRCKHMKYTTGKKKNIQKAIKKRNFRKIYIKVFYILKTWSDCLNPLSYKQSQLIPRITLLKNERKTWIGPLLF